MSSPPQSLLSDPSGGPPRRTTQWGVGNVEPAILAGAREGKRPAEKGGGREEGAGDAVFFGFFVG